jgi:hypothetical protein
MTDLLISLLLSTRTPEFSAFRSRKLAESLVIPSVECPSRERWCKLIPTVDELRASRVAHSLDAVLNPSWDSGNVCVYCEWNDQAAFCGAFGGERC